jgi:prepilin-type N-terminal cleavage/methylation domain-containing protein
MGHPGSNRWSVRKRFVDRLHELRATQHGFTLLELLIGVVIVSILAAVATQYFLHQRRKGWVAQVRASTRHMAGAQNYFVFDGGASGFTNDLDDLYLIGYRWDDLSVRPYVALATNQTYCVQVHSAHDPSIVWHFSSNTGYPQEGPATPNDCGDPEVLGTYIAGLPPASAGRDGVPSGPGDGSTVASTDGSGNTGSDTPPGGGSTGGGTTSDPGTDTPPSTGSTGTGGTGGAPDPGGTGGATDPGSGGTGGTGGTGGSGGTTDPGSGGSGGTSASGGSGGTSGSSGSSGSGGSNGGSHGGGGCKKDDKNDPDGDENGGHDAPGGSGGTSGSQDCNNGSGNDADGEDDNNGGGKGGK